MRAADRFNEGEARLAKHDYRAAAIEYLGAWQLDAKKALYALRLGIAREHLQDYAEAAAAYRSGLKVVKNDPALQEELTHRMALLAALRLDQPREFQALLPTLPPESPRAADLRAVAALLAGDGRQALSELNTARRSPLDEELAAIVLYHAARAYHLLGNDANAFENLYQAINHTNYTPVAHDIEEFRNILEKRGRK